MNKRNTKVDIDIYLVSAMLMASCTLIGVMIGMIVQGYLMR